jgi:hypothetical protein
MMFEPREVEIEKVEWPKKDKDVVTFYFKPSSVWAGAKRKDFWRLENWEDIIKPGVHLILWTVGYSGIIGFQMRKADGKWRDVWCALNDFNTKAEEERGDKAYTNFIIKEGKRIANWIDAGKTLEQIDDLIDKGHSGNTYACALSYGIQNAKNKHNAELIKVKHNMKYGHVGNKGVVNPAVITIGR